ncbi:hypothetical protein BHE74_00026265, partial [Ensete ventricosum]
IPAGRAGQANSSGKPRGIECQKGMRVCSLAQGRVPTGKLEAEMQFEIKSNAAIPENPIDETRPRLVEPVAYFRTGHSAAYLISPTPLYRTADLCFR